MIDNAPLRSLVYKGLTIEGYSETLTATDLRFSFNTTDASPLYVFTLDSDSLGLLDSDTRLAY